jgi:recombinational DNA repair protein RecR
MFETKIVDKIKTHILCSVTFFQKSCRLCDNVEKSGTARQTTDDNIIRRMRFACWVTKATDTLIIFNTRRFSTTTVVTPTRLSVAFIRTLPGVFFC